MGPGSHDAYPSIEDYLKNASMGTEQVDRAGSQPEIITTQTPEYSGVAAGRRVELANRLARSAINLGDFSNVIRRLVELQEADPRMAFDLTLETQATIDSFPDSEAREIAANVLSGFMSNLIHEARVMGEGGALHRLITDEALQRMCDSLLPRRTARIAHKLEDHNYKSDILAPYLTLPDGDEEYFIVPDNPEAVITLNNTNSEEPVEQSYEESFVEGLGKVLARATTPKELQELYETLPDILERDYAFNVELLKSILSTDEIDVAESLITLVKPDDASRVNVLQAYDSILIKYARNYFTNNPWRPDILYAFMEAYPPQLESAKNQFWQLIREAASLLKTNTGREPVMPDGSAIPIPVEEISDVPKFTRDTKKSKGQATQSAFERAVHVFFSATTHNTAKNGPLQVGNQLVEAVRTLLDEAPPAHVAKKIFTDLPDNPELTHLRNQQVLYVVLKAPWRKVASWADVIMQDSTDPLVQRQYNKRLLHQVKNLESGSRMDELIELLNNNKAIDDDALQTMLDTALISGLARYKEEKGHEWSSPTDTDGQIRFF